MYPPIFSVVAASLPAQAILGTDPVRFWPFGEAPADPELPYAVWQTIFGTPRNYINQLPDGDSFGTQIDVYANEATAARLAAKAIRDAVEPVAYVTGYNGESRDPQTQHYRYSFNVDFIINR